MAESPPELQVEIEKLERKHAADPQGRYFVPLANAYRKRGDVQHAEALLRDGLQQHPEYLSAHVVLGQCLSDRKALPEAEEEFRYVLSVDPQNLIALRQLGEIALAERRIDDAKRWYGDLLAADPMNEDALSAMRVLQRMESRGAQPLRESVRQDRSSALAEPRLREEEFSEDEPLSFSSMDEEEDEEGGLVTATIAELYFRQGLYDRSIAVLRELIRRRGGDEALERRLREVEEAAREAESRSGDGGLHELVDVAASTASTDAAEDVREESTDPFAESFAYGFAPPVEAAGGGEEPWLESGGEVTISEFLGGLAMWKPPVEPAGPPEVTEPPVTDVFAATSPAIPQDSPPEAEAGVLEEGAGEGLLPWESFDTLDEVTGAAPTPVEPHEEELFTFEDYLSGEEPSAEESPNEPIEPIESIEPASQTPEAVEEDDDLESFQEWLRSLKR